jgi:fructose-bisphosphate aldolase class I
MRSVINSANADGVNAVVAQQFEIGKRILAKGLMPIIEPEVTITAPDKPEIEALVLDAIGQQLADLGDQQVMLKLSLPDTADHYAPLIESPNVLRVVALSGGYDLDESCRRLSENHGMIASFSRVLTTGLSADQEQAGFDTALDATINQISEASAT